MIIDINEMTYCDECGDVKDESELLSNDVTTICGDCNQMDHS